jgi:hypothetical protein
VEVDDLIVPDRKWAELFASASKQLVKLRRTREAVAAISSRGVGAAATFAASSGLGLRSARSTTIDLGQLARTVLVPL